MFDVNIYYLPFIWLVLFSHTHPPDINIRFLSGRLGHFFPLRCRTRAVYIGKRRPQKRCSVLGWVCVCVVCCCFSVYFSLEHIRLCRVELSGSYMLVCASVGVNGLLHSLGEQGKKPKQATIEATHHQQQQIEQRQFLCSVLRCRARSWGGVKWWKMEFVIEDIREQQKQKHWKRNPRIWRPQTQSIRDWRT